MDSLLIVGGGLAGCEAAWQAANKGIHVNLCEMRPFISTGAHTSGKLAELVCSNSLGSNMVEKAAGLLKHELRELGSLLIQCADETSIAAGEALAVDRIKFANLVTERIVQNKNITIVRKEVTQIPDGFVIIASGPLTSNKLARSIQKFFGMENLFFYDAIAPIVTSESIDMDIAFPFSRYGRGVSKEGDYINCPLDMDDYQAFVDGLISGKKYPLKDFEQDIISGVKAGKAKYFEACLPIEELARRGVNSLAFGPMRPVGIINPRSGTRPYAIVQLRSEDRESHAYNLVGFQTNLLDSEQERIFRMIPGLNNAFFMRYGRMHRNTFIYSPGLIRPTLQSIKRDNLFFAGQIAGIEGYCGNIACGWIAGINAAKGILHESLIELPKNTMIGSLIDKITREESREGVFQPVKANLGLLSDVGELDKKNRKTDKRFLFNRSLKTIDSIRESL